MNVRPHFAPAPVTIDGERVSVRVERVCELMDCQPSQVYRMIAAGDIEAHGLGVRGVRIYLDSVAAYRTREMIQPKGKRARRHAPAAPMSPASRKAHDAAVASLRARGLIESNNGRHPE